MLIKTTIRELIISISYLKDNWIMSTELYGSGTAPYYLNHLENDYLADQNIINGNHLNLFPEQALEIYKRCFNYLATCQLSSRCARIFCAVMNQTIIFGKLEDNVTSTRLQQLTKIRRDHAASAMRELAANNVIIHRRGGEFHNYVSINFNLESWGSGRANKAARSNDPRHLISDNYADEAVDQGLKFTAINEQISDDEVIDQGLSLDKNQPQQGVTEDQAQTTAVDIIDTEANKSTKPQEKLIDQDKPFDVEKMALLLQDELFSAFDKLEEKVCIQLRNIEEKVQHSKTPSDNDATCQSDQTVDTDAKTSNSLTAEKDDKSTNNNLPKHPVTQPEILDLLGDLEIPNRQTIHRIIPMDELIFPTQLTSFQCDNLKEYLLPRADDKAQALLKILAKRLNNNTKPVKNCIAYFSSLVKKLEASTLDLSTVEIEMQVEQLDKKIEAITLIYNQERNNYYHCQNLVEQERQKHDLDFGAAAEKIQMTEILDNYVDKLDKMRVAGQPLFDARATLSE